MGEYERIIDELSLEVCQFRGSHPERLLGAHPLGEGKYRVAAFLPRAVKAWIEGEDGIVISELSETLYSHLFACVVELDLSRLKYKVCFEEISGHVERRTDPYLFRPTTTDFEIYLFKKGDLLESYRTFGSHLEVKENIAGVRFTVWAPNARSVSVIGNFNHWIHGASPMANLRDSGIWELFIPDIREGEVYKYAIRSAIDDNVYEKTDPYAFHTELRPNTGSIVVSLAYTWKGESRWNRVRDAGRYSKPMSIYEVHLGSWRKPSGSERPFLNLREFGDDLIEHVRKMGFTHIELMPIMEHPFDGSWGYQTINYYAPTSRYGRPEDYMWFIDRCHQKGIGVILDWVPAHFPDDHYGLSMFDGTHLFDHSDPRLGFHPDWGTRIFNYTRNEVRNFLLSSALFWIEKYHADGIRIDAVSSMLYLDYSRKAGEWIPNKNGGRENLEAIEFLRTLNETIHRRIPGVLTIAEESTAWGGVTEPVDSGGLGFDYKWNMGWMHDTLYYFSRDPIYRKYDHGLLPFTIWYAFSEKFILPFSHDEVVHLKGSLLSKMPGDEWQKFANLRACLGFMYASPGKKLLFMGSEIAEDSEWSENREINWNLLDRSFNRGILELLKELNGFYRKNPEMHEIESRQESFRWIDFNDSAQSVISFERFGTADKRGIIFVFNLTPLVRYNYAIGVEEDGNYTEVMNTDSIEYGGSGVSNGEEIKSSHTPMHGREYSIELVLPPLSMIAIRRRENEGKK